MDLAIALLGPGDEEALHEFLRPRLAASMFLASNTRRGGLEDRGAPYQGTYTAAWREGRLVAVAAHVWNGTLILQAPEHLSEVWRAAVTGSGRPLRGVLGPSDQVDAVLAELEMGADAAQLDEDGPLYRLALDRLAVPEALTRGEVTLRQLREADLELVTGWLVDYAAEALGEEPGPELRTQRRGLAERMVAEQRAWLLEHAGRAVALSAFNAVLPEAVQVGPVWTPPAERRRGYARAAVAGSLLEARAAGASAAVLFTAKENRPAQRAYEALGFEQVGGYRIVLLREPLAGSRVLLVQNGVA